MNNLNFCFAIIVTICFSLCFYGCSSKSNNCRTNDMCNDHGTCFVDTGLCSCDEGYSGDKCQTCSSAYKDYGDKLCKPIDPCAKDQTCVNQVRNCSNVNGDAVCGSCLASATEVNGWCYTVDKPVITGIDGDGTAAAVVGNTSTIQNPQLATHRFQTSWVITGNYLNNIIDVELDQGGSKVFNSADGLIFQRGDTNMTGRILLPALLSVGAFTLIINSYGGQASAQVYVLQGESVTSEPEAAGTNCKYGGVKITSASGASYVCSADTRQTYLYTGTFPTSARWEADLLWTKQYNLFCEAIGKSIVGEATELEYGWMMPQASVWSGMYYYGAGLCKDDPVIYTDGFFTVSQYVSDDSAECPMSKNTDGKTVVARALITCE